MNVEVRYDEDRDVYEIGAEIEGAFVPFSNVTGSTVRGHIARVNGETVTQPPEQEKGAGA